MNARIGAEPWSSACWVVIFPARNGCNAVSLTRASVGIIVKAVRKIARLTSTWLGGVSGMPRPWRIIDSTTTMRTNGVMQIAIAGISARKVRTNEIRTASEVCEAASGTSNAALPERAVRRGRRLAARIAAWREAERRGWRGGRRGRGRRTGGRRGLLRRGRRRRRSLRRRGGRVSRQSRRREHKQRDGQDEGAGGGPSHSDPSSGAGPEPRESSTTP